MTHTQEPRVINVDKNADLPKAIDQMKKLRKDLSKKCVEYGKNKYLSNQALQDHRFARLTKKTRNGDFHSFNSHRTLREFEADEHVKEKDRWWSQKRNVFCRTEYARSDFLEFAAATEADCKDALSNKVFATQYRQYRIICCLQTSQLTQPCAIMLRDASIKTPVNAWWAKSGRRPHS